MQLPHLYAYSKHDNISIISAFAVDSLIEHFHLSLSTKAFSKFQLLENIFESLPLASGSVQWIAFGSDSHFKVSNAYKEAMGSHIVSPVIKWL
jgi:hypothetical protein